MSTDYYDAWGAPSTPRRPRRKSTAPKKYRHVFCGSKPGPKGRDCKRCRLIEDYQNAREAYEIRKETDCDVDSRVTKREQRTLFQLCAGIPVTLRRWLTGGRSR